jgi:uncharacterized membrane protein
MPASTAYPMTHQGVRDLDRPLRASRSGGVNVGRTERMASAISGAMLVGYGLSRGSLLGYALAAVGGSLLSRGLTGHCSLYSAAGVDTSR